MPLSTIDPGVLSALQAGNASLSQSLSDGYKSLGINQSTPITNGVTDSGTSVSSQIAALFNKDLEGGLLPQSDSSKNSSTLLDDIFNPFGIYNKALPSGSQTNGNPLSAFSFGRIVVIVLGFVLIGGGIILFAGEDIIGTVKQLPKIAELGAA